MTPAELQLWQTVGSMVTMAAFAVSVIMLIVRLTAKWTTIEVRQEALLNRITSVEESLAHTNDRLVVEMTRVNDRLWHVTRPDMRGQRGR